MEPSKTILTFLLITLALSTVMVSGTSTSASAASLVSAEAADNLVVVRVYYNSIKDIQLLVDYEFLEYNNLEEHYVLVAVDQAGLASLKRLGFRIESDAEWTADFNLAGLLGGAQIASIPGYACYRTVEETYTSAATIVAAHPDLAEWIDVGDSWEKVTSGGQPGYDMMVLKLTNSAIGGSKPKLFITGSIHAREYATAELVMRFGEYLVDNYGVDADATWLLDYHEVHLMMYINPDGHKKAETGLSWRKNTDNNYCANTDTRGVDLNRNFSFQYGKWGGSSGSQCDLVYRGPIAVSEPETQAVQSYLRAIFPDQRADSLTTPAPADATGVYIDFHSAYASVYWPWGFNYTVAPNGTALQTMGRKLAYFNGYLPAQQVTGISVSDGTTYDFAYGDLGVAAFIIELGGRFFEPCSAFESTDLPKNLPALIYAAKVARAPYLTPLGPDVLSLAVSPTSVAIGDPTTITATINDTRYNTTNGSEATQSITAAEYFIDIPPWQTSAVANNMNPSDGSFNAKTEGVTSAVNTSSLSAGRHTLFVRGKDLNGNWGAFSAIFLTISGPANQVPTANPQSISMDEDTYANFTLTGSDADGDALTFQMSVNPSHGTLSGTAPNLTHTPAADYNGADSLTFVVNDGKVNSAPATVNLNITAVNDAPVITEGTFASVTMSMNGTPIAFAMTLLATDVDTSDTIITWSISSAASHGTASASGTGSSKAINYTPNTDYVGSDSFVVQVSDGSLTDTINVNVTVSATPIPYQIYLPLVFQ